MELSNSTWIGKCFTSEGGKPMPETTTVSLKHVRRNCLECSGDSPKAVTWCPCDGLNSTRCEFWPFRFGLSPKAFLRKYGPRLLSPALMPSANVDMDDLPAPLIEAATSEINVDGYHAPPVEVKRPRKSPEELEALAARFRGESKQPR
jgi:hypothetical protein